MASTGHRAVASMTTKPDEAKLDRLRLLTTISNQLKIPRRGFKDHPIALSLTQSGIEGWNEDFVHLTAANIEYLQYVDPTSGTLTPLAVNFKMKLRALLAFFHHVSHSNGGAVVLSKIDPSFFDEFRTKVYDPNEDIIPWARMTSASKGLQNWNKTIKPNARDFKTFRDSATWIEWKDGFLITLQSQNLTHLIDPNYVIIDQELDKAQSGFLYKVMMDQMIHHSAKQIVKRHKDSKDTRTIWKEACDFYDNSITSSLQADAIMSWLSETRLDKITWTKGQGEFINQWLTQARKFNELAPDSVMQDPQLVRMLQNALQGTPNLSQVLYQYKHAREAAGRSTAISLYEYSQLLSNQAQVYDNANTRTRSSLRRSTNVHDVTDGEEDFETHVHDVDSDGEMEFEVNVTDQKRDQKSGRYTSSKPNNNRYGNQKRQANQMQGTRSRAYMDRVTWEKLSEADQKAWDTMSDAGKNALTYYHFNKGKEVASRDANKVEAKNHELEFDDESEDDTSVVEAKTHEVVIAPEGNAESTRKMYEEEGIDFGLILQAQKASTRLEAKVHRIDELTYSSDEDDEEESGLEVNSHWFKGSYGDDEEEELFDFDEEEEQEQEDEQKSEEALAQEEAAKLLALVPYVSKPKKSQRVESDTQTKRGEIDARPEKKRSDKPKETGITKALLDELGLYDFDEEFSDEAEGQEVEELEMSALEVSSTVVVKGGKTSPDSDLTDEKGLKTQANDEFYQEGITKLDEVDGVKEGEKSPSEKDDSTVGHVMTRNEYKAKQIQPPELFNAQTPEPKKKSGPDSILKNAKSGSPSKKSPNKNKGNKPQKKVVNTPKPQKQIPTQKTYKAAVVAKETGEKTDDTKKLMAKPFEGVEKPSSKTTDRIIKEDSGKFKLISLAREKEQQIMEEEGLYDFDDDEASLQTVEVQEEPTKTKTGNTKVKTEPVKGKPKGKSEFHKSALEAAEIGKAEPKQDEGGNWVQPRPLKNKDGYSVVCGLMSPKAIANKIGLRNPTPPGSSDDASSQDSANSNRFSPLADDEEDDSKTTEVIPVYDIDSSEKAGPKLVRSESKEPLKEDPSGSEQDDLSAGAKSLILLAQNSVSEKLDSDSDQDFQKAGSN